MKDFDLRFRLHPITGDLVVRKETNAITQSLRSILMHKSGDRRLNPEFGVGIGALLFENVDHFQIEYMKKQILTDISVYEKRIAVVDLTFTMVDGENALDISIYYKLKKGGRIEEFSLTLERTL